VPTWLRPGVINVFNPLKPIASYFEEVHITPRASPRCIAQPTCTLFVQAMAPSSVSRTGYVTSAQDWPIPAPVVR